MNPIRIHRHRQGDCFTILPNALLQDASLSWGARGLVSYLLSLPEDWVIQVTDVMGRSTDGKARFYSLKRELEAAGYLRGTIERDARGVIVGNVWEVTDQPGGFDAPSGREAEPEMGEAAQKPVTSPVSKNTESGKNSVMSPLSDFPEGGKPGMWETRIPENPPSGNPPTTKETITKDPSTKDPLTNGWTVRPDSLPAWDQYGMQFAELPWEGEGRRLDQGFVEHLTQRWSKGREVGDARAMATGFVRKSRRCETDFLRVQDAWELYQAFLIEQRQKEQQAEQAKADEAERAKWMRSRF